MPWPHRFDGAGSVSQPLREGGQWSEETDVRAQSLRRGAGFATLPVLEAGGFRSASERSHRDVCRIPVFSCLARSGLHGLVPLSSQPRRHAEFISPRPATWKKRSAISMLCEKVKALLLSPQRLGTSLVGLRPATTTDGLSRRVRSLAAGMRKNVGPQAASNYLSGVSPRGGVFV